MAHRDDPPPAAKSTVSRTAPASAVVPTSGSATSSSSTSPPAVDPVAAPLAACRAEVAAGEALAVAAADSARDWGAHAGAEVSLDAGRISYAQAEKIWAASKKPGPADIASFAAAQASYNRSVGGCGDLAKAASAAGASAPSAAAACVTRAKALATVATTGANVNDQWAAHQAQMKTKATAAGPAYHQKWMDFVADSKPVLTAYRTAASALAKAPGCS